MKLDEETVAYLCGLPAVSAATVNRITYEQWFGQDAVRRWMGGERPCDIFARAGMPPRLIGHKRVERCMARWRDEYRYGVPRKGEPGYIPPPAFIGPLDMPIPGPDGDDSCDQGDGLARLNPMAVDRGARTLWRLMGSRPLVTVGRDGSVRGGSTWEKGAQPAKALYRSMCRQILSDAMPLAAAVDEGTESIREGEKR